jgi:LemA protein
MPTALAVAVAVLALLGFWTLGAHNRLVRLRNRINAAWTKLQEALAGRDAALLPLVAALRAPMASEQGALDGLWAAHLQATQATAALAASPVAAARAVAWVAAESALAAAAGRVLALLDQDRDLSVQEPVASLAAAWRAGQARLPFARQVFNEAAMAYNQALMQFPTRLLLPTLGFASAGLV